MGEEVRKREERLGELRREKGEVELDLARVSEARQSARMQLMETQKLLKSGQHMRKKTELLNMFTHFAFE